MNKLDKRSQIAFDEFVREIRNCPNQFSDEWILLAAKTTLEKHGKEGSLKVLDVLEAMIRFTDPSYHGKISAGAKRLLACDQHTIDRTREIYIRMANAIKDLL